MRLDENGDFTQSDEQEYDPHRFDMLQEQLTPRGSDAPQSDARPVPDAPQPQVQSGSSQSSDGGSNRDAALSKVQQTYQSSLGRAAQGNELQSSLDNFLKYGENGKYGGELANITARASNLPGGIPKSTGVSQYTGGGQQQQAGGGSEALNAFLAYLQSKDAAGSAQQASLRDILMSQLAALQQPLTAESPGISQALQGQRVASQRAAERLKAQKAESLASQGLGRSGALESSIEGINQQRGESDTRNTGHLMYQELSRRGQQLTQLLSMAIQSGDAEGARLIQAQLQSIQTQLQNTQFNQSLNQNQNQFQDNLGLGYNQLNANQNSGSLAALLSLLG